MDQPAELPLSMEQFRQISSCISFLRVFPNENCRTLPHYERYLLVPGNLYCSLKHECGLDFHVFPLWTVVLFLVAIRFISSVINNSNIFSIISKQIIFYASFVCGFFWPHCGCGIAVLYKQRMSNRPLAVKQHGYNHWTPKFCVTAHWSFCVVEIIILAKEQTL